MITVFTCDNDFTAMFSCIHAAWSSRLGHEHIRLQVEPVEQLKLFENYVHVDADEKKAESVIYAINCKISPAFYSQISYCLGAYEQDTLDTIYRVLILGFAYGEHILSMYQYKDITRFLEISRRYGGEAHSFLEFLRFHCIGGRLFVAHIEPKSRVVMPVAEHFADRMPSEYWIIVDDIHKEAAVHPADSAYYMYYLTEEELEKLKQTEKDNDSYTLLWKTYFDTIAIKERKNPKCQLYHFPIWKRTHAVEFL